MPYADRDAQRRYQREWAARRRAEWIEGRSCEICGGTDDLEVHHKDPEGKAAHAIWSWSAKRREAELAKCELLCRRCHQRLHSRARLIAAQLAKPCGTNAAYSRGCRCAACRAAHADHNRRWLETKRRAA